MNNLNGKLKNLEEYCSVDDLMKVYFNDIGKNMLLTLDQEQYLATKAFNGDKNAKQILIETNLRLVVAIAKKYNFLLPCHCFVSFFMI